MELPTVSLVQIPFELLLNLGILALILVATWIVAKILGILVSRVLERTNQNVARQAKRVVVWLTWLLGISIGLNQLGSTLTLPVMIIVIAVVVIIALRDVLLDAIAHEVITTYNPFKIGDWIQVGKFFGRVVDITWTNTVLMTPNSEMVYIPNSTLTKNIVVNRTTQSGVRISVSLRMEKSLDFSEVEKSLLEIGEELGEELATDSKPEVRLIDLENSSMKVALLLRINNPAKGKILASEVRKRMKMKLEELQRRPK
jgi:small conductance mechanosensitive channel